MPRHSDRLRFDYRTVQPLARAVAITPLHYEADPFITSCLNNYFGRAAKLECPERVEEHGNPALVDSEQAFDFVVARAATWPQNRVDVAHRQHALLGAPGVDFLDRLGLDPDVDICGFPFHAFCAVFAFFVKAGLIGSDLPRTGFMRRTRSDFGNSFAWARRRRAVFALISLSSLALDHD